MNKTILALAILALSASASAEYRSYGDIELMGLSREHSWPLNPRGETSAMVCNVNGPDGFLSVRSGPGTTYDIRRKLNRLAILTVDTSQIRGNWIRVVTAGRTHTKDGFRQDYKSLHVSGWAHTGFMCDFVDF